jgi:hypothetical protein
MGWHFQVNVPVNGRVGKAEIFARDDSTGSVLAMNKADLVSAESRTAMAEYFAEALGVEPAAVEPALREALSGQLQGWLDQPAPDQDGAPAGADLAQASILDSPPDALRRPLSLIAGRGYAATWLAVQREIRQSYNTHTGQVETHDPPRRELLETLAVFRDDGEAFASQPIPGFKPLDQLGFEVVLPSPPPPGRAWSGEGVKRFLGGDRPRPADVFRRLSLVVDRFIDFNRSLAPQGTMCDLVACYVLGTYLLDGFNVVGYLWPNGGRGSGKTTLLNVVSELAYLGLLILAGGSYASLRDLADYGATLCFDDAEGVMDPKRGDPDKQALLLAGNRRNVYVPLKQPAPDGTWTTRYVHAFCPRLFSAIQLPNDTLGSRSIILPLVASDDPDRAKGSPQDLATWPAGCERRRLVDDLWSLALTHLPRMREYDGKAAARASLSGRMLEPWRVILGVALWLQERHGLNGLFDRLRDLSDAYQKERADAGCDAQVRVLVLALRRLGAGREEFEFATADLAGLMNDIARQEGLVEEGPAEDPPTEAGADEEGTGPRHQATFITATKLGRLLKRHRLKACLISNSRRRGWQASTALVEQIARAFGIRPGADREG